jgi:hypothetical protein
VARRIGGLAGPAPTVLEARRPALDVTVAAHALLAGAARLGSELLTQQLPAFGPPWAAALLACARPAEADRDHALALNLATRAAGVAEQLFPATLVDRDAGAVAAEAVELVTALRSPPR